MRRILTVCTGNICRSPIAEAVLRTALSTFSDQPPVLSSAGLHAMVGHGIDADTVRAAQARGIVLHDHAARQFDSDIGRENDLILVMETHHRQEIGARWPHLLGKTFVLGHFDQNRQVPDPYKQGAGMHEHAVDVILQCSASWAQQLRKMKI